MHDAGVVRVLFTLYRSFYASTSSTTSVRADSAILKGYVVLVIMWCTHFNTTPS